METEAAPQEILQMISCKCKLTCKTNCTCQKTGMNCFALCINCDGKICHGVDLFESDVGDLTLESLTGCGETPLNPDGSEEDDVYEIAEDDNGGEMNDAVNNTISPPKKKKK
ncbi:hypothetical protein FQA39_LY11816 [Lamprigera yunnana]|nr:hypothetical protein FQA39_LY11816 [Lamprigera yunnana]